MGKNIANTQHTFYFCDGGSCNKAGSQAVVRSVRAYLRNTNNWENTHSIKTRCNGRCEDAPTCIVQPGNYWYKNLTSESGVEIVKQHIEKNLPTIPYLLYCDTWKKINSDCEKPAVRIKAFERKEDPELGTCLMTRGFSSDQYLYPLFLFLWQDSGASKIRLADGLEIEFKAVKTINYSKEYAVEIITKSNTIELVIAPVPKGDMSLQQLKISTAEYYIVTKSKQTGIRLKNKFGNRIADIHIGHIKSKAWKYCTEIQLQNMHPEPYAI